MPSRGLHPPAGGGDLNDVRAGVHGLAPPLTAQQVAGLCGQVCRFLTMLGV